MTDVFTPDKRSEVMSRIRSQGNYATELVLAKLFRQNHITGWRRHFKLKVGRASVAKPISKTRTQREPIRPSARRPPSLVVRPDFIFPLARVAVFVDGCFWHCCPKHSKLPVSNRAFWQIKLEKNKARDRLVNRVLWDAGWQVIRIWEHELTSQADECVRRVDMALSRSKEHL